MKMQHVDSVHTKISSWTQNITRADLGPTTTDVLVLREGRVSGVRREVTELAGHVRERDASHAALLPRLWFTTLKFSRKKLGLITAIQIKLISLVWLLSPSLQRRRRRNRTYLINRNSVNNIFVLVHVFSRAVNTIYWRWILLSQKKYIFYMCMNCRLKA